MMMIMMIHCSDPDHDCHVVDVDDDDDGRRVGVVRNVVVAV